MRDSGIFDTFHIFRVFKVSRIFDKSDTWCLWVNKKSLTQHFAVGLFQAWSLNLSQFSFFMKHSSSIVFQVAVK